MFLWTKSLFKFNENGLGLQLWLFDCRKAQYNNAYGDYRGGYHNVGFRRGPRPPLPALMDLPRPPFEFFGPPGSFGPSGFPGRNGGPGGPRHPGPPFRPGPMNMYGRNFQNTWADEKAIRFLMSKYGYV